mmetsp:Transcript_23661/g.51746  ORF Transcript_23661/g.51746 Transcript_23661/m.51746 type:complete len:205 (-) Transcript_23661:139-753(-)
MGAVQAVESTRCCGGGCERGSQLKLRSGHNQVYEAWSDGQGQMLDTGVEPPVSAEAIESNCGTNWGRCCTEPVPSEDPSIPAAAAEMQTPGPVHLTKTSGTTDHSEFLVHITKPSPTDDLGLKVLYRDIGVLAVAEIYPHGAAQASNAANARACRPTLEVNDLIVMVNGIGGDDVAMAQECRRSQHLSLAVKRGGFLPQDSRSS